MIHEWKLKWEEMPHKGKSSSGMFRRRPDEIFRTNNRQLISTVTQLRTDVGYFKRYLFKYPTTQSTIPCVIATEDTNRMYDTYSQLAPSSHEREQS
jgi:hypothetical protein